MGEGVYEKIVSSLAGVATWEHGGGEGDRPTTVYFVGTSSENLLLCRKFFSPRFLTLEHFFL